MCACTGIILPPAYIKQVAAACREVGAIFVLDGIASGTAWVDMGDLGVDAFITAPQKGWSGPAAVGVCMMNDRAKEVAHSKKPTSFTIDLAKWDVVMNAYLSGGHMYHATMPTDAIRKFRDVVHETEDFGLKNCEDAAWKLGTFFINYSVLFCRETTSTRVSLEKRSSCRAVR